MKPDLSSTLPSASGLSQYDADVTPDDGVDIADAPAKLWIGTGGNIRVTLYGMDSATSTLYKNVPDGFPFPGLVKRVWATDTTAADIIANW